MLNVPNSMIINNNYCIRKTILIEDCLSAYTTQYILLYFDKIISIVLYFTIFIRSVEIISPKNIAYIILLIITQVYLYYILLLFLFILNYGEEKLINTIMLNI